MQLRGISGKSKFTVVVRELPGLMFFAEIGLD